MAILIMGYTEGTGAPPTSYSVDFESSDKTTYEPDFTIVGAYTRFANSYISGTGWLNAYDGTNYLKIGRTSYNFSGVVWTRIQFHVPAGATSPNLSVQYRRWHVSSDTSYLQVHKYTDGTYSSVDTTVYVYNWPANTASTIREFNWNEYTSSLDADGYYEIYGYYYFRTANPNFGGSHRPPSAPGESLHLDAVVVSWT